MKKLMVSMFILGNMSVNATVKQTLDKALNKVIYNVLECINPNPIIKLYDNLENHLTKQELDNVANIALNFGVDKTRVGCIIKSSTSSGQLETTGLWVGKSEKINLAHNTITVTTTKNKVIIDFAERPVKDEATNDGCEWIVISTPNDGYILIKENAKTHRVIQIQEKHLTTKYYVTLGSLVALTMALKWSY